MANKREDVLGAYASEMEGQITESPFTDAEVKPIVEKPKPVGGAFNPNTGARPKKDLYENNLGWQKIPIESLPTEGKFYPDGTEIVIRSARGEEIKHWSTMNDQDVAQISRTDDILNYIIERCVSVKVPDKPGASQWKDLKNVDRLYLLLAVHEFSFPNGQNELHVPVSEGKDIAVVKEMIDYINIPAEIMNYYSAEDKCFVFTMQNGNTIKMHIPSIGVNSWLKTYASNKISAREGYDEDFMQYAPMLIRDWRNLTVKAYEDLVQSSSMWSTEEWSLVSYVYDLLSKASEPMFKYTDESGVEVQIPVTFRGGLKALFTIHNPLQFLR